MRIEGKCSEFGGADDDGMQKNKTTGKADTGLALYEPWEADLRPDIFLPAPAENPKIETWKRLRTDFPFIAIFYSPSFLHEVGRAKLQNSIFHIINPKTGQWVAALLVDNGPSPKTGRIVDLSKIIMTRLRLETDDEVVVTSDLP